MKNVIAVDFDGTLCENRYPDIGEPITEVIRLAKKRQREGWAIILWTCRCGKLLDEAISWCHEKGLDFDAINENIDEWKDMFGGDPRKVGATEYWDDRSVNFSKGSEQIMSLNVGAKCKCNGFLKKVSDGTYIQHIEKTESPDGREHYLLHNNEIDNKSYEESESECCGEHELLKTYYERKEREFEGVIVGKKEVIVTGWLVVDTDSDPWRGERTYIRKEPEEIVECAVVYFSQNKKRYVPFDCIKEVVKSGMFSLTI